MTFITLRDTRLPFRSRLFRTLSVLSIGLFACSDVCFSINPKENGAGAAAAVPPARKMGNVKPHASIPADVLRQRLMKELRTSRAEALIDHLRIDVGYEVLGIRGPAVEALKTHRARLEALDMPHPETLVALWTFLLEGKRTAAFTDSDLPQHTYLKAYAAKVTGKGASTVDILFYLFQGTADYIYHWARPQGGAARAGIGEMSATELAHTIWGTLLDAYIEMVPGLFARYPQVRDWPNNYHAGERH